MFLGIQNQMKFVPMKKFHKNSDLKSWKNAFVSTMNDTIQILKSRKILENFIF